MQENTQLAERGNLSANAVEETRQVVESYLHKNWRMGFKGGKLFKQLSHQARQEFGNATAFCHFLKSMELEWDVDWVDTEEVAVWQDRRVPYGRERLEHFKKEEPRLTTRLVTVFFSMRDENPVGRTLPFAPRMPVGAAAHPIQEASPDQSPELEEDQVMLTAKSDKLSQFVIVHHEGTNTDFRMHQDDMAKLGTPQKVCVYDVQFKRYYEPDAKYPAGRYTAGVHVFVASYLELKALGSCEPTDERAQAS